MLRQSIHAILLTTIVISNSAVIAQFGVPPNLRTPNQTQPNRRPRPNERPPEPSAEDILRLIFPPPSQLPPTGQYNSPPPVRYYNQPLAQSVPSQSSQLLVASQQELQMMSSIELRRLLRKAIQHLDENLAELPDEMNWKDALDVEALGCHLWCKQSATPNSQTRKSLTAMASGFEKIAGNDQADAIHGLWGFQTVRAALGVYATDPLKRQQQRVQTHSENLQQSLDQVATGAGWNKYLKIADIAKIIKSNQAMQESDHKSLKEIINRFDQVRQNEAYQLIVNMYGFDSTHRSLMKLAKDSANIDRSSAAVDNAKLAGAVVKFPSLDQAKKRERLARSALASATIGSSEADAAGKLHLAAKDNLDEQQRLAEQILKEIKNALQNDHAEATEFLAFPTYGDGEDDILRLAKPATAIMALEPAETEVIGFNGQPAETTLAPFSDSWHSALGKLELAPERPDDLDASQSNQMDEIVKLIKAGKHDAVEQQWKEFVKAARKTQPPTSEEAIMKSLLREAYLERMKAAKKQMEEDMEALAKASVMLRRAGESEAEADDED